jgi:hypothetical protein
MVIETMFQIPVLFNIQYNENIIYVSIHVSASIVDYPYQQ